VTELFRVQKCANWQSQNEAEQDTDRTSETRNTDISRPPPSIVPSYFAIETADDDCDAEATAAVFLAAKHPL
jgi:hypothetical protein